MTDKRVGFGDPGPTERPVSSVSEARTALAELTSIVSEIDQQLERAMQPAVSKKQRNKMIAAARDTFQMFAVSILEELRQEIDRRDPSSDA